MLNIESGGVTACRRWISLGLLCIGLGSLGWTTPHFATPPYQPLEPGQANTTSGAALCGAEGAGAGGVAETAAAAEAGSSLQVYRCRLVSPRQVCCVTPRAQVRVRGGAAAARGGRLAPHHPGHHAAGPGRRPRLLAALHRGAAGILHHRARGWLHPR